MALFMFTELTFYKAGSIVLDGGGDDLKTPLFLDDVLPLGEAKLVFDDLIPLKYLEHFRSALTRLVGF